MKISKLRKQFTEERNAKILYNYKQQQNYCSNLLKKSKTHHFNNLIVKDVTKNKCFWKTDNYQ